MDQEFLKVLRCPKSQAPVELMAAEELAQLNRAIGEGKIKQVDGAVVKKPLSEALITRDHKTVYRIDDGIPLLVIEQGIALA